MDRNPQRGYLLISLAIGLALTTSISLVLWNRLGAAHKETARVTGEFTAFKEGVRKAGKKAEDEKAEALKVQKEAHDAALKNLSDRHYALGVKYAGLLDRTGSPGGSVVPAVPDTARPVDDTARDRRLLEVLRVAEIQTIQLIGWIEWAEANKNSCGRK